MDNEKKLSLLEDIMNLEAGDLSEELELSEISEWDSMAYLLFMDMLDEEFDKHIKISELKEFQTIQDLLEAMND